MKPRSSSLSASPMPSSQSSMSGSSPATDIEDRARILQQSAGRHRRDSLICASSIRKTVAALHEEIAELPAPHRPDTITIKSSSARDVSHRRRSSSTSSSTSDDGELLEDFPTSSSTAQRTSSRSAPTSRMALPDVAELHNEEDDETSSLSSSPTTTVVDLQDYAAAQGQSKKPKLKSCLSNSDLLVQSTDITSSTNRPSSSTTARRKSVVFAPSATCTIVPFKTDEELFAAWYTPEERTELQKEARRAVKLRRKSISEGELNRTHGESGRGVEHYGNKALLQKLKQQQDDVIDAVLLLQQHWRAKGLPFNAKELAYTSYTLSSMARDRAYLYGAEDAAAAKTAAGSIRGVGMRRSKSLS